MFHVPEKYRITNSFHPLSSDSSYGNNGAFEIIISKLKNRVTLFCIASDGAGWEHVSVSLKTRTPTWNEMCFIKNLFWDEEDCVIQFHPPKSDYINNHEYCLHLWRPIEIEIPRPNKNLVGI